jgi:hypothetical protein
MAISRIQNKTQLQIDTDYLIKKIRVALSKTEKIQTSTTMGIGGKTDEPPYYSLSGKILQDKVKSGRVTQVTSSIESRHEQGAEEYLHFSRC